MEVLITGATGFVGKNLIAYLQDRKIGFRSLTRSELISGDTKKINSVDAVVHLAGKAHDLRNSSDPLEYYQVNFELTKQLYSQFLLSEAKTFIFISSVKASADRVPETLRETDLPDPQTDYGRSKLMAEQFIQAQPLPEDKSYYILRPCMIHGPGNKGNLNLLYQVVRKRIPYPLASYENRRSFLSVENLCFVIQQLLTRSDITSGVYQVADDEVLSTNELIRLIGQFAGIKTSLLKIPPGLVGQIARIGDRLKLPLNSERLKKLTESYVVENSRLKLALGIGLPVSAREGLRKTIQSFQKV